MNGICINLKTTQLDYINCIINARVSFEQAKVVPKIVLENILLKHLASSLNITVFPFTIVKLRILECHTPDCTVLDVECVTIPSLLRLDVFHYTIRRFIYNCEQSSASITGWINNGFFQGQVWTSTLCCPGFGPKNNRASMCPHKRQSSAT